MKLKPSLRQASAAVAATVAVAAVAYSWTAEASLRAQVSADQHAIAALEQRLDAVAASQGAGVDWRATASTVRQSVVTIEAGDALGSGWVARAGPGGSDIVTNYHVVADSWRSGAASVSVHLGDRTLAGTVQRVDVADDLAVVHVSERLPALVSVERRPDVGTMVMAVGSPLGLGGTISVGVVSGYRSLEGSDYMQFSAPISPGNSGGPVVDGQARVVAIASAKLVGDGIEALSLGIPVQVVCGALVDCVTAEATAAPR